MPVDVVVVGQVARDLVLTVADVPGAGEQAAVRRRYELLGGKGANQAVGLAQLGMSVTLVGVVGADRVGTDLMEQAGLDGVDTASVVRREGTETALIVNVVDSRGHWHYLEHIPEATLVTGPDVVAAGAAIAAAESLVVQLRQPADVALEAARLARAGGTRVVLDGAPSGDEYSREPLLAAADVLRADAREGELLAGRSIATVRDAILGAHAIRERGPELVVLEVAGSGNVFVDAERELFLPHTRRSGAGTGDTTGGGDALVAGLTATLTSGGELAEAARLAVAAAGATVERVGGRPDLGPATLRPHLDQLPHPPTGGAPNETAGETGRAARR
ncbi:ribokinase [Saccharomonospora amisosensis]|uniref:Ribokinase n=1 Tax=Saccharomonospora amisosensis TaxID=1128677 RepID=A0A7X5ZQ15_9PSEU|nr:PfkB family carbohydrate kinase [Saccharomonospora amisosensis]NIJ11333.1 ribokinase [Saccharomonospora amisosensis]